MKTLWILVLLTFLVPTATARAEAPERRWGLGWDNGIGLRYRLNTSWGLGLRVNPDFIDEDRMLDSSSSSSYEDRNTTQKYFTMHAMVYRETDIGENLGVGAFLGTGVTFGRGDYNIQRTLTLPGGELRLDTTEQNTRETTWFAEFGFRPTLTFRERFVLETRVGVRMEHTDRKTSATTKRDQDGTPTQLSHSNTNDGFWHFNAFGQNLGPGAVVQFMIYF